MPHPFDATLKDLISVYPHDWLRQLGLPVQVPVETANVDLSTVSADADRVLRVHADPPWLIVVELQAARDPDLELRGLQYFTLVKRREGLPVHLVVVLLRREADNATLKGRVRYDNPTGLSSVERVYQVVRLWEMPVQPFLQGGLGTLPLAPLADLPREELPGVIRHMERRFREEAAPEEAATLWTASYILLGLRYPKDQVGQLIREIRGMKESVTYQAIIEEGATAEAQRILLRQGNRRFGQPDERVKRRLESVTDLQRLEDLSERLLDVSSWEELLS